GDMAEQVLAHERAHLARRDHWWKPLGFLLLAVYWFNPVLWLAYILLCRDIELACDEKVIRTLDSEEKQAYAETLLECSLPRFAVAACPLAFGEVGIKERIRAVVNYKKPAFWIIIAALCACAALAVCLLTNPKAARIKLAREDITGVSAFHLENVERDGVYELNSNEIDELAERVNDLRSLSRGDKYAGLSPLYGIQVSTRDDGYMNIRGYNADGSMTDISYKGKEYRVDDDEFKEYVLRICEGVQRAEAQNADSAAQPGNTAEQAKPTVTEIIDRSVTEGIATDQATELFWETDGQEFYFPSIKSHLIIVKLTNGEELPVKEALEKGIVTLYDLGKSGIEFYGVKKELVPMKDFGGVEYLNDGAVLGRLFNMPTAWLCAYYLNSDGAFAEGAAAELNARNAQSDISPVIEMVAERYPENADAIRRLLYQAITTDAPGGGQMAVTQFGPKANEDVVCVQIRPTERIDIDGYGYYVPEDQAAWKAAWDEAKAAEHESSGRGPSGGSGMTVMRGTEWMDFHTDGSFERYGIVNSRIDAGDGAALAALVRGVGEHFGIDPVYPDQLRGILRARLQLGYDEVHEITDAETLAKIEKMLSGAEELGYMTKCPFTSLLTLELKDGREYAVSIATDSCGVYLSDGLCFRFAHGNEEFFELFGVRLWP
ncbi:MAG: M56 family metallopeptidase, partial [Oscillospiraceae bacterium]|nr:M56 family metallopeptidase [Oscillospiraceae bacterium]